MIGYILIGIIILIIFMEIKNAPIIKENIEEKEKTSKE
jgi:hypothetical protein